MCDAHQSRAFAHSACNTSESLLKSPYFQRLSFTRRNLQKQIDSATPTRSKVMSQTSVQRCHKAVVM
jgi:hypothetical protein